MAQFSIQCRCVIAGTDIPVPNAICSVSNGCRKIYRFCDLFGVCEFCVPCGCYRVRCECTPANVLPDPAEFNTCMGCRDPEIALTFQCPKAVL